MMTAMLTVRNILAGARRFDVWAVNEDAEYHEAGNEGAERVIVPPLDEDAQGGDFRAALGSVRAVPRRLKAA